MEVKIDEVVNNHYLMNGDDLMRAVLARRVYLVISDDDLTSHTNLESRDAMCVLM